MYLNKKNNIFSAVFIGILVLGVISTAIIIQNPLSFFSKAFEKNVIFTISPESSNVKPDQDFNVSINLNPNGNTVSTVELVLEYDPTTLTIGVDNVELGTILPRQIGQATIVNVDPTHNLLKINLAANCTDSGCTPAKDEGNLVTVTFKGLADSSSSPLSLSPQTKAYSVYETTANPTALTYIANKVTLDVKSASTGIKPIADIYVKEGSPTTNFANESMLIVSNSEATNKKIAYLKFDLTGVSGVIQKAQLKLTPRLGEAISKSVRLVSDTNWDEQTITWNTKPQEGTKIGTYAGTTVEGSPVLIDLDTSYLSNYTGKVLALQVGDAGDDASTLDFFSKESTGKEPELLLQTEPQVATNALTDVSDTYVQSQSDRAGKSYGIQDVIIASNYESANLKTLYVKFQGSQLVGKKIKSAKLTIVPSLSRKVDKVVRSVNSDWSEGTVTYNSRPILGLILGKITSGDTALVVNTPITVALDPANLTVSANGEISIAIDNTESANSLSVYSKEYQNAAFRPILTVETY